MAAASDETEADGPAAGDDGWEADGAGGGDAVEDSGTEALSLLPTAAGVRPPARWRRAGRDDDDEAALFRHSSAPPLWYVVAAVLLGLLIFAAVNWDRDRIGVQSSNSSPRAAPRQRHRGGPGVSTPPPTGSAPPSPSQLQPTATPQPTATAQLPLPSPTPAATSADGGALCLLTDDNAPYAHGRWVPVPPPAVSSLNKSRHVTEVEAEADYNCPAPTDNVWTCSRRSPPELARAQAAQRWMWQPDTCRLMGRSLRRRIRSLFRGRHVYLVGDSLTSQFFNSLLCLLGLRSEPVYASDPYFGHAWRALATFPDMRGRPSQWPLC